MPATSIITVLKKEHKEVSALLEEAIDTGERETAKRAELYQRIQAALRQHTAFEEERVYPILERKGATKDDALEAFEEHAQAKRMLEVLDRTDPGDEHWKARMTVLAEDIRHHVKEEEGVGGIFSELSDELDRGAQAELAEAYERMKAEVPAGAH